MTFQSSNSFGYFLWLQLLQRIYFKQNFEKRNLQNNQNNQKNNWNKICEKIIPNDYKSIYVEVEQTFLCKLSSYTSNIFLYLYNKLNNHITTHIIAVEQFNEVRNYLKYYYNII